MELRAQIVNLIHHHNSLLTLIKTNHWKTNNAGNHLMLDKMYDYLEDTEIADNLNEKFLKVSDEETFTPEEFQTVFDLKSETIDSLGIYILGLIDEVNDTLEVPLKTAINNLLCTYAESISQVLAWNKYVSEEK